MKRDFAFPNPIKRTDLPKGRRRWRYVAAGIVGVLVLVVAFLPQLLSSRIGRNLIKMYLESHYQGQVWITDWRTRWFGPTYVHQFSLTDPQGRQIKFTRLDAQLPLWKLLLGRYELGNAAVTGLSVEYVIDYGDGTDTLDRLPVRPASPAGARPLAPLEFPPLSGHIALKNATFILTRGEIDDQQQLRSVYRSMRFAAIDGTLDIVSADQPWKCDLKGLVGLENASGANPPATAKKVPGTVSAGCGEFSLAGAVTLGAHGRLDAAKSRGELRLAMEDVPNVTRPNTAPLGWLLLPVLPADDWSMALGPVLQKVDAEIRLGDGMLNAVVAATGHAADGAATSVSAKPVLNLAARPRLLMLREAATANLCLSRRLAQSFSYVDPFLHDAVDNTGRAGVSLRDMVLMTGAAPRVVGVNGELSLHDVTVASGQVTAADEFPREPITQYQAIVGSNAVGPRLDIGRATFTLDRGLLSVAPYDVSIDGRRVNLSGSATVGGSCSMLAQVDLPPEMRAITGTSTLAAAITGPADHPMLGRPQEAALSPLIERHLQSLRDRRIDQLLQASRHMVRDLLQPYERLEK